MWSSYRGTPSTLTRRVVDGTIKKLIEHQVSNSRFLKAFDSTNMRYCSLAPQLFLVSSADKVIDYNDVIDLADGRKQRGVPVYTKVWNDCNHLQMFRKHPDEYEKVLKDFFKVCLDKNLHVGLHSAAKHAAKQHWLVQLE